MQFSLRDLLEYIAWCSIVAACTGIAGIGSGIGLMLFALALWFRQGATALAMLTFATLATGANRADPQEPIAEARFLLVLLLAAAVSGWYAWRRSGRLPTATSDSLSSPDSHWPDRASSADRPLDRRRSCPRY